MEAPQYSVKPKMARALVPELLKLVFLCAIFYSGILVNLSLLQISIPLFINIMIILVLLMLVALEVVLTYLKNSKMTYDFFPDRIEIAGTKQQSMSYLEMANPAIKRTFFDRHYNTGTIVLQRKMKLSFVENPDEVFSYIQNMIAYRSGSR